MMDAVCLSALLCSAVWGRVYSRSLLRCKQLTDRIWKPRASSKTNESLMCLTAVIELQSELFDARAGSEVISQAK